MQHSNKNKAMVCSGSCPLGSEFSSHWIHFVLWTFFSSHLRLGHHHRFTSVYHWSTSFRALKSREGLFSYWYSYFSGCWLRIPVQESRLCYYRRQCIINTRKQNNFAVRSNWSVWNFHLLIQNNTFFFNQKWDNNKEIFKDISHGGYTYSFLPSVKYDDH